MAFDQSPAETEMKEQTGWISAGFPGRGNSQRGASLVCLRGCSGDGTEWARGVGGGSKGPDHWEKQLQWSYGGRHLTGVSLNRKESEAMDTMNINNSWAVLLKGQKENGVVAGVGCGRWERVLSVCGDTFILHLCTPHCCCFFFFYWSLVDLQCCVSFRYTAKWISYTYTYIHSLDSFPTQAIAEYWVESPVLPSCFYLIALVRPWIF